MSWTGKTFKPAGTGPQIDVENFYGPSDYTTDGFLVTLSNISNIIDACICGNWETEPTSYVIPVVSKILGNTIVVKLYGDSGSSGPLTEISEHTDVSGFKLTVIAFGQ